MTDHDWQHQPHGWVCPRCTAIITHMETACKPMPHTQVGTEQVPALKHLPIILDGNGDPDPMLSCDEVQVAIVMES